jgi:hypothetical protein
MKRDELPADAPPTFATLRTIALAALAELVDPQAGDASPWPALLQQARAACCEPGWTPQLAAAMAQPQRADASLAAIAREARLSSAEVLALAIVIGAELDPLFARVVNWLQGPSAGSAPTLGLLAAAAAPLAGDEDAAAIALAAGPAAQLQLLVVAREPQAPLAQLPVRVPLPVLQAMAIARDRAPASADRDADEAPLSPAQRDALLQAARALERVGGALVLRAVDRIEARAAAQLIAATLKRQCRFFSETSWPTGVAVAAAIEPSLPVFDWTLAPGERITLPAPPVAVPVLLLVGPDGAVRYDGAVPAELRLGIPVAAERALRWRRYGFDPPSAAELAERWRCGYAQIDALMQAAAFHGACAGRDVPAAADVLQAARALAAGGFEGTASILDDGVDDDELALAAPARDALHRLAARCRVREQLPLDLPGGARCAVRALFAGPSGTGKTLAAQWLATRLGLPLVVVDLAALTSKWVGETEKNLAQLFARAEQLGAVLLFDEADSIFGARTDVASANDRFANNQTNYLLARIDRFDGIVILTSNARARLDPALARRLDAVVEFALPGPDERRALWRLHLGRGEELPAAIERLAVLVDLPGGHVRTAALAAQARALAVARPLEAGDVAVALRAEYAKLGRVPPAELLTPSAP